MAPPIAAAPLHEPVILVGIGTDAVNTFEDLSGLRRVNTDFENPYDILIAACDNDPVRCLQTVSHVVCQLTPPV